MNASRPGSLSVHLVAFCQHLRSKGFTIGPREELEMFTILGQLPFNNLDEFRLILAQLLCRSRAQQLQFDELFGAFWKELFTAFDAKLKPRKTRSTKKKPAQPPSIKVISDWLHNRPIADIEETAFYSPGTGSSYHDLLGYQSDNIKELVRMVNQLAKDWASRPSRRKVRAKTGGQIDLRKIVRKNLSTGEMIQLVFRENKKQKPRLILMCDVSRSMELFTNFTVRLLYAFQNNYRSIETFVFGTELYHVSRLLKHQPFKKALENLSEQVPDWSTGTRIGYCLDRFIADYGSRMLRGKVIFLMISDGWDTGEIELLKDSLHFIKRRVEKLIWLNPQAGKPGFKPEVQGMVAALPYIDDLNDLRANI